MATGPRFPLSKVKAAVGAGRVSMGKSRAWLTLMEELEEMTACHRFTCALAMELEEGDFCRSVALHGGIVHDEYGLCASDKLLAEFGLRNRAWYLKLTMRPGTYGDEAMFLSVHLLERPMLRVGGLLKVDGTEEES